MESSRRGQSLLAFLSSNTMFCKPLSVQFRCIDGRLAVERSAIPNGFVRASDSSADFREFAAAGCGLRGCAFGFSMPLELFLTLRFDSEYQMRRETMHASQWRSNFGL